MRDGRTSIRGTSLSRQRHDSREAHASAELPLGGQPPFYDHLDRRCAYCVNFVVSRGNILCSTDDLCDTIYSCLSRMTNRINAIICP